MSLIQMTLLQTLLHQKTFTSKMYLTEPNLTKNPTKYQLNKLITPKYL